MSNGSLSDSTGVALSVTQRVLMDVDTGVDDALAIMLALRTPTMELVGVTTGHGNAPLADTTRNTLQVLELAGRADIPVAAGADKPLTRPFAALEHPVHGEGGLGGAPLPPPQATPLKVHAADFIIRQARRYRGDLTLITTGRLTNLALALQKEPQLPQLIKRLVIMGGAVVAPGNVTPAAEANVYYDPEAAQAVFKAGFALTLVGLDVTCCCILTPAMARAMVKAGGPVTRTAMLMTTQRLAHYEEYYPYLDGSPMHDPLAVAVAADPTLVSTRRLHVDVEIGGELTRGMTLADRRWALGEWPPTAARPPWGAKPNVEVCLEVDADRFFGLLRKAFAGW